MNCIKCYQEIPEGSRFCPYCGAEQTAASQPADAQINPAAQPGADAKTDTPVQSEASAQTDSFAQPEADAQTAYSAQSDTAAQNDMYAQPGTFYQITQNYGQNTQNYGQGTQDPSGYGTGYQGGYQNNPYQSPYQQDQGQPVNWVPYLVLSIISTICCCPPFGIVAIVFAAKINSAVNAGNTEEAKKSAKTAKIWIIVAFAAGIISYILYFALVGFIGASGYYYY